MKTKFEKVKFFLKEFRDKDLLHYASSLSFHTILALIPILLISLSIFTKLPSFKKYYELIKHFIFSSLIPSQQETISAYIDKFLDNTLNMGIIGFIFVIYVSVMFFMDYEYIVSKIFKTKPKSFWQSISTYWTLVTLLPMGIGVSFFVSNKIQHLLSSYHYTSWINILIILPFFIFWMLFFIMYMISINTKVDTKIVLLSSFIASTIWYISKTAFIYYVSYNKTYTSIYGSFSTIMFFFIWIYFSWVIYIYGLKVCYLLNRAQMNTAKTSDPKPE